jgi:hypothetical protein
MWDPGGVGLGWPGETMTKPWKELGRYGGVGIELVLAILILAGLGHWLDEHYWGNHGWGTGVGFFLGIAVGVRNLVRAAANMQRDIERAEADDPEAGRWTVDESWLHESEQPKTSDSPHLDATSSETPKGRP